MSKNYNFNENKVSWAKCSCSVSFTSKYNKIHENSIHEFDPDELFFKDIPFVWNDSLVARIEQDYSVSEYLQHYHSIYINPSTMSFCNFVFNQPLSVNRRLILRAMPDKSLDLDVVKVPSDVFKILEDKSCKMYVIQSLISKHKLLAHRCCLTIRNPENFVHRTQLTKSSFFKDKRYVFQDEEFAVSHFSSIVILKVHCMTIEDVDKKLIKNENSLDITNNVTSTFENLSLTDNESRYATILKLRQPVVFVMTANTSFYIKPQTCDKMIKLKDLGSLEKEKEALISNIGHSLLGADGTTRRGCLLFGPSGVGKSSLVRAVANHCEVVLIQPAVSEIFSEHLKDFQTNLDNFYKSIKNQCPCIVFFDDLERFCPINITSQHRWGACYGNLFNEFLKNLGSMKCFVIGTTKRLESVNPLLRNQDGFFVQKIEVNVPNLSGRCDIFRKLLSYHKIKSDLDNIMIEEVMKKANGFSGADLSNYFCEIQLFSRRNNEGGVLKKEDFLKAICRIKPSALREIVIEVPKIKWKDIGGREDLKELLELYVTMPLNNPEMFTSVGLKPPKGILLYGPPGCSKTMMVKALAGESGLNFISVQGTELHSMWVGETEQHIKELFKKARSAAPSVIFFDEIEAFAVQRGSSDGTGGVTDRAVQQLLVEVDGVVGLKGVFIIAATNRPDLIDKAFVRSGRFDKCVYVPLPDYETRKLILEKRLLLTPVSDEVNLDDLCARTENFSCAEVSSLIDEACYMAINQNPSTEEISMRHLFEAVSKIIPRTSKEIVLFFEEYHAKYSH